MNEGREVTSREEMQIERSRHQLGQMVGIIALAMEDAESLLRAKALRSPASAEAEAHRRICGALAVLKGWSASAGPVVGIEVPNGHPQATPATSGA